MQEILKKYSNNQLVESKFDIYQSLFLPFIESSFFPWLFVVLLLNKRKWNKPVTLILVGHWLLRAIGDILRNYIQLRESELNTLWPGSTTNWYIGEAAAHVFWLGGEILGDWYPLLRTKAVTNNNRKVRIIFFTCILYNITKILGMLTYFIDFPMNLKIHENGGFHLAKFNLLWWSCIGLMQITSFIYDLSVILALKSCLFNKLNEYRTRGNTFLDKFKQISELRIFCSMIISILFFPFLIAFIISLMKQYQFQKNQEVGGGNRKNSPYIEDEGIEHIRQLVLGFNFTLMYIDQILLRNFVENNNQSKKVGYDENNNGSFHMQFTESLNYSGNSHTFKDNNLHLTTLSNNSSNNNNNNYKNIISPVSSENTINEKYDIFSSVSSSQHRLSGTLTNSPGIDFYSISNKNVSSPIYETNQYYDSMSRINNNSNNSNVVHYNLNYNNNYNSIGNKNNNYYNYDNNNNNNDNGYGNSYKKQAKISNIKPFDY